MQNRHLLLYRLFLNNRFIISIVIINAVVIFTKMSIGHPKAWDVWDIADFLCTMLFLVEMMVKHREYGLRSYWQNGWNRFDGLLVILSLPSLAAIFWPSILENLAILKILRLTRVLRMLKMMRFFPNFNKIADGFRKAMRDTYAVWICFFILILIFGMVNCALFSQTCPDYFFSPLRSIYTVFQICTVEGWYEIPNAVANGYGDTTLVAGLVRLFFCGQLMLGGIIGMSLINSIFVDAMVADNNDELLAKVDCLQQTIDKLNDKISIIENNMSNKQ